MKPILVLVSLILLSLHSKAWACSCIKTQPVDPEFARSSAVFHGRVTQIVQDIGPHGGPQKAVTFEVLEKWKGKLSQEVIVFTGTNSADCGFHFVVGKEYLVYASGTDRPLRTTICTRTRRFSDAFFDKRMPLAEEVMILDGLKE